MVLSKKAICAVAGVLTAAAGGAWAQTTSQDAAAAKKAQGLGLSTSTLSSLSAADKKTLTRLFNRMTATEKAAVTRLLRASSRPMGGSMGSGMGTSGSMSSGTSSGTTTAP